MRKWAGRKGGRLKRECVGDWLTGGDKKGGMDDERNRGCGLVGGGGGVSGLLGEERGVVIVRYPRLRYSLTSPATSLTTSPLDRVAPAFTAIIKIIPRPVAIPTYPPLALVQASPFPFRLPSQESIPLSVDKPPRVESRCIPDAVAPVEEAPQRLRSGAELRTELGVLAVLLQVLPSSVGLIGVLRVWPTGRCDVAGDVSVIVDEVCDVSVATRGLSGLGTIRGI